MPDLIFASKAAAEAIRNQQQINAGAKQLQDEYRQSAREAGNLERAAKRIYEQLQSPQEKLIKKMGQIEEAQRKGLIPPKEAGDALTRLQTKMGDLEGQSNKTFGKGAVDRLALFAGGIAPVAATIKLITDELKSQVDLIDKAAQTQLSLVPSRQNLIDNLAGSTPEEINRVLAKLQSISLRRGVPEAITNDALGSAISASGKDVASSVAAVDFAARRFADRPENIAGFSGSLLDLNDVTGSSDPRVSAGLLVNIAQQARLTKATQINKNAPKALTNLVGFGATREGAAALFSTISNAIKDAEGEVTKTAVINVGKELDAFRNRATGLSGFLFRQLPTVDSQIAAIQSSPELREQFFSKPLSVPGEAIIPVRDLFTPGSVVANRFAQNRAAIPGTAGLINLAEESIDNLSLDPNQPLATADRQLAALNEDLRRQASPNLTAGARDNVKEILQRVGRTNLGAAGPTLLGQLSDSELGTSVQESSDILEGEATRLSRPRALAAGGPGGGTGVLIEPSQADLENSKLLQNVSDILERSVTVLEEQKELQKETNRKLEEGGLMGGPN